MAFQFVPNADGSFTEGDKQTNPESGVEYMFHDGAWRPLGPEYNEEIQDFDDRYLKLSGGDLTGALRINDSGAALTFKKDSSDNQFQINPNGNSADYWTNVYGFNSGGVRFRVTKDNTTNSYGTCISIGVQDLTLGGTTHPWTTQVNFLRTPTNDHHAANKKYVDDKSSTITSGTNTNPTLSTGQLYYNTSTKQLFIGE